MGALNHVLVRTAFILFVLMRPGPISAAAPIAAAPGSAAAPSFPAPAPDAPAALDAPAAAPDAPAALAGLRGSGPLQVLMCGACLGSAVGLTAAGFGEISRMLLSDTAVGRACVRACLSAVARG